MKERGILFKDFLVRKILAGEKTQTRRLAKPGRDMAMFSVTGRCPYGVPGDRLYVKEGWGRGQNIYPHEKVIYRADCVIDLESLREQDADFKWVSPLLMPRWASRITLELTEVRVQRCQDISFEDIIAEGFDLREDTKEWPGGWGCESHRSALRAAFSEAWDRINADRGGSWAANPWVWALGFRRLKP